MFHRKEKDLKKKKLQTSTSNLNKVNIEIDPFFEISLEAKKNIFLIWFAGIWLVLIPADFTTFKTYIECYITVTQKLLQQFYKNYKSR